MMAALRPIICQPFKTQASTTGHMPYCQAYAKSPVEPEAVLKLTASLTLCSQTHKQRGAEGGSCSRRAVLSAGTLGAAALLQDRPAQAVQGLTAGRIPGTSSSKNSEGYLTYMRPEGKSGGHGVGWSEIPRYAFDVPEGWTETPVSIADLGGTEIDVRFGNPEQGKLSVVVAPVLRFADVGFNASVTIEELGSPDKIIQGFAPELYGSPLSDGDVLDTQTQRKGSLTYYQWELKPHRLVAATAFRNRMFLIALDAKGGQWRKASEALRHIQRSFRVVEA